MADLQTIVKIRKHRDEIRKTIKKVPVKNHLSEKYGSENEYDIRGLLSGLESILFDISALTKSPNFFVKISNYSERNNIVSYLNQIQSYLQNNQFPNVTSTLDALKIIIRNYNIRLTEGRNSELLDHIDELQRKASVFSRNLEEIKIIRKSSDEIKDEINKTKIELESKIEELDTKVEESETMINKISELVESLDSKGEKVNDVYEKIGSTYDEVAEKLTEAKSHNEVITNFSKRVEKRESQLDQQEQETEAYKRVLTKYKEKQDHILEESKSLIESAKLALNYKTAEGLSIAFREKYDELKDDGNNKFWIIGAGAFFVSAVAIGVWILADKGVTTEAVIGRVSLIPLLIGGSWFCANQYLKHRNLMEDYAYKSVLVKSIVGFSSQLSGNSEDRNDEYNYYLKSMLDEIHNHPLIKKNASSKSDNQITDDAKYMLKELKDMIGKISILKDQ